MSDREKDRLSITHTSSESHPKQQSATPSIWDSLKKGPLRVCIIGSGNWGTAIARVVGQNCRDLFFFQNEVKMWVFEEDWKGEKLSSVINKEHENVKYMPGVKLPANVVAEPDIRKAAAGADILVFVVPHQFVQNTCKQLLGFVQPTAMAVSLIKGFDVVPDGINLMSEYISSILSIPCTSLSGANVAHDVAREQFAECTLGYDNAEAAPLLQQLFHRPYFRVNCVNDVKGVEICGALKNIVALGAGFCDGLGLGSNTKAAIIRMGMEEIIRFCNMFYPSCKPETFGDSCGLADLITTCFGGRNRRCAEEFVKSGDSWLNIEARLLKGQKLQGTGTSRDVHGFLKGKGALEAFPLFQAINKIVEGGARPSWIVESFMLKPPASIGSKL